MKEYGDITDHEFKCQNCKGTNKVTIIKGRIEHNEFVGLMALGEVTDSNVQSNVAEAGACLQEAVLSLNGGLNRAATVMARAALEVTLEWAGFNDRELAGKIGSAATAGAIDSFDKRQAENVRLIGNFGAHGTVASYVPDDGRMSPAMAEAATKLSFELVKKVVLWRRPPP